MKTIGPLWKRMLLFASVERPCKHMYLFVYTYETFTFHRPHLTLLSEKGRFLHEQHPCLCTTYSMINWSKKSGQLFIFADTNVLWQYYKIFCLTYLHYWYFCSQVIFHNSDNTKTFTLEISPQYNLFNIKINPDGNPKSFLYSIVCLHCIASFSMLHP